MSQGRTVSEQGLPHDGEAHVPVIVSGPWFKAHAGDIPSTESLDGRVLEWANILLDRP